MGDAEGMELLCKPTFSATPALHHPVSNGGFVYGLTQGTEPGWLTRLRALMNLSKVHVVLVMGGLEE